MAAHNYDGDMLTDEIAQVGVRVGCMVWGRRYRVRGLEVHGSSLMRSRKYGCGWGVGSAGSGVGVLP